jgi:hypothetical protein
MGCSFLTVGKQVSKPKNMQKRKEKKMQLRTELNTIETHKQNLPRGYFKKRKHEHERPSQKAKMMQTSCLQSVSKNLLIILILSLGLITSEVSCETSNIEPDLKRVVGLNRTEAPISSDNNRTGSK